MNTETTHTPSSGISVHLPLGLLALAICLYFGVEYRTASKQAEIMRWQLGNLDKQADTLKAASKNNNEQLIKAEVSWKEAEKIQEQYVNMFNELLDIARDDKDAREVVEKWGIKRNEPEEKK